MEKQSKASELLNIENSQIKEFILSPLELELLKHGKRGFTFSINHVPIEINSEQVKKLLKNYNFKLNWIERLVNEQGKKKPIKKSIQ